MGMEQHIEKIQKERSKAQQELGAIVELQREFPDLEVDTDRWGRTRYMARSANPRVNEVVFHRNCGCCADSPVHARPCLKLNNGTYIYSNPCNVKIGEPYTWSDGFREYEGWRKTYEEAEVNPAVVEEIQRYIDSLSAEDEEEDDDDDYED